MTNVSWSIEVELDEKKEVTEDDVDSLTDLLKNAHPAIGQAPNGNLSIRIMVDAPTAYQAFDLGTARVKDASRTNGMSTTVVGVHLETEAELERRL